MTVFEKISAQQGEKRDAVWAVGEQLKDICRNEPDSAELVFWDLDVPEMSIAACEKKIKAFADAHRTGKFACVIPEEAEKIIREFYGLNSRKEAVAVREADKIISLESFL